MRIDPTSLVELCKQEIQARGFPAAAFCIGTSRDVSTKTLGTFTYEAGAPVIEQDSLFDLASLTKVMATTPAAMLLHDDGLLDLDKPVQDYLPDFKGPDKDRVVIRNLLLHDSGLPAYATLTKYANRDEARKAVLALPLKAKPGEQTEYSCMSMITLQQVVESIAGEPIDGFLKRRLYDPLGMHDTCFNPGEELRIRCAPTENDADLRKRLLQGEVHDPAAFACGGLSGNAGLFSTIEDVARYARFMLDRGANGSAQVICSQTIETWTKKQTLKSTRALGWDTKSSKGSSAGSKFSIRSFGHTGYTGTSIWIDPENGFFAVLLTNRVHPTSKNDRILKFRPKFHDVAFDILLRAAGSPRKSAPERP